MDPSVRLKLSPRSSASVSFPDLIPHASAELHRPSFVHNGQGQTLDSPGVNNVSNSSNEVSGRRSIESRSLLFSSSCGRISCGRIKTTQHGSLRTKNGNGTAPNPGRPAPTRTRGSWKCSRVDVIRMSRRSWRRTAFTLWTLLQWLLKKEDRVWHHFSPGAQTSLHPTHTSIHS
jgi:hypothetical protein